VATVGLLGFGALGVLALSGPVSAVGTLSVTPSTDLHSGDVVSVSGSGFVAKSTGGIVECNNNPDQPTIEVVGNAVPVGCSDPINSVTSTSAAGVLSPQSFTIETGVLGPPTEGTDSAGNDADTDAALYPCPPTAAQIALGDSCAISFGDQGGDQVSQAISFAGTTQTSETTSTTSAATTTSTTSSGVVASTTSTPTTAVSTTSSTVVPNSTTSTTKPTVATSSNTTTSTSDTTAMNSSSLDGQLYGGGSEGVNETIPGEQPLAYTGSGPGVLLLAVSGLCLMYIGFLVMTLKYRPRELSSIAAVWIGRLFGGDERPTTEN